MVVLVPNIDLMGVMLTAQFVNGLVPPVPLVFMAIIAADKRLWARVRPRIVSRVLIWSPWASSPCSLAVLLVMQVLASRRLGRRRGEKSAAAGLRRRYLTAPSRRRLFLQSFGQKRLLSPLRAQSSSICTVKLTDRRPCLR